MTLQSFDNVVNQPKGYPATFGILVIDSTACIFSQQAMRCLELLHSTLAELLVWVIYLRVCVLVLHRQFWLVIAPHLLCPILRQ